jgi:adenylate cyclase
LSQHIVRILAGLAITVFFLGHAVQQYPFVSQLDNILYDARLRLTLPREPDKRIVILDIDEKSLGELGRWPWNRKLMAELVDKLFERHGVALLGFDVVWAERDSSSGIEVLDAIARDIPSLQGAYAKLRPGLDFDVRFAASLKGRPVVLGYYFNDEERAVKANQLPPPTLPKGVFEGRSVEPVQYRGYTGVLPLYLENAAAVGHINPLVDFDGVLRRVPLIAEHEGQYYEALSLAMARTLLARQTGTRPPVEPGYPDGSAHLEWFQVGELQIPVDANAAALIPFRARGAFRYVSLADVIKDRVAPGELKGAIAIVGTTAPTLLDMRATPVAATFPGVEVHANLIAGILDEEVKKKPRYVLGAEIVLLLVLGVVFAFLIPRLSAVGATLAATLGLTLAAAINFAAWQEGLVLPLAASVLTIGAIYILNMAYGYFVESRARRRITDRFREYVPPEVVAQLDADPDKYDKPKEAQLSILFADIRGFTGISETLRPEALREYIDDYLTEMSTIIRSTYRGTLDKYIGDAIMAFWGAPMDDPEHARNAVLAALAMQKQCPVLNARFAARGWPALRIGVGVNSGTVRVGNMGSRLRRAYTAMGDAVNVASRLEGRTKSYGVGILVGEATRNMVMRSGVQDVVFREIDRIKVKGRDEAITIYEPLGPESEAGELRLWNQALRAYRTQQWDEADVTLGNLTGMFPGRELYRAYAQKVADRRRDPPPPGWDGVTAFDEK